MDEEKIVTFVTNEAKDMLEKIGFEAGITAHLSETEDGRKYINIEVEGEDLGILIGYQGVALKSFEQVLELMLIRFLKNNEVELNYRVILDINDYRKKKDDLLKETALKAIEQVKEHQQPIELTPMSPRERRVIHLIVQEEEGVKSTSEGEEGDRRVVIHPDSK